MSQRMLGASDRSNKKQQVCVCCWANPFLLVGNEGKRKKFSVKGGPKKKKLYKMKIKTFKMKRNDNKI